MKGFEVHFLAAAAADLDELFCYIAKESSLETADRYLNRLEGFCLSLSTLPARGTAIPGRVPAFAGWDLKGAQRSYSASAKTRLRFCVFSTEVAISQPPLRKSWRDDAAQRAALELESVQSIAT